MDQHGSKCVVATAVLSIILFGRTAAGTQTDEAIEPAEDAAEAKALFTSRRCHLCHSVSEAGVKSATTPAPGPDLSGYRRLDATALHPYLTEAAELRSVKHPRVRDLTSEETDRIAEWLAATDSAVDID